MNAAQRFFHRLFGTKPKAVLVRMEQEEMSAIREALRQREEVVTRAEIAVRSLLRGLG